MNRLNELIDDLVRNRMAATTLASEHGLQSRDYYLTLARQAVAFDFGQADYLMERDWIEIPRFPYPVVWVESDLSSTMVDDRGGSAEILSRVGVLAHEVNPERIEAYIFLRMKMPRPSRRLGPARQRTTKPHWIYQWAHWLAIDRETNEITNYLYPQGYAGDARVPLFTVLSGFSAMQCDNVEVVEHRPKKSILHAGKSKAPLVSTWTLHITGKKSDGEPLGGTHASPRVHLRRGHRRQYAPGKYTWVQPCVVGKKELGVVHKDYVLDESQLAAIH